MNKFRIPAHPLACATIFENIMMFSISSDSRSLLFLMCRVMYDVIIIFHVVVVSLKYVLLIVQCLLSTVLQRNLNIPF